MAAAVRLPRRLAHASMEPIRASFSACGLQSGETVEAREARIAATYERALLCIQDSEQGEAVVRCRSERAPRSV